MQSFLSSENSKSVCFEINCNEQNLTLSSSLLCDLLSCLLPSTLSPFPPPSRTVGRRFLFVVVIEEIGNQAAVLSPDLINKTSVAFLRLQGRLQILVSLAATTLSDVRLVSESLACKSTAV